MLETGAECPRTGRTEGKAPEVLDPGSFPVRGFTTLKVRPYFGIQLCLRLPLKVLLLAALRKERNGCCQVAVLTVCRKEAKASLAKLA